MQFVGINIHRAWVYKYGPNDWHLSGLPINGTQMIYTEFWSLIPYHICYYRGYMYRILICSFVNELRKAHGSALAITQFIHNQLGLLLHHTKTARIVTKAWSSAFGAFGKMKVVAHVSCVERSELACSHRYSIRKRWRVKTLTHQHMLLYSYRLCCHLCFHIGNANGLL
jgi:hypothetical protein